MYVMISHVFHSDQRNIQILTTSTKDTDTWVKPYMVTSQGQYIGAVGNICVNLPSFVFSEF